MGKGLIAEFQDEVPCLGRIFPGRQIQIPPHPFISLNGPEILQGPDNPTALFLFCPEGLEGVPAGMHGTVPSVPDSGAGGILQRQGQSAFVGPVPCRGQVVNLISLLAIQPAVHASSLPPQPLRVVVISFAGLHQSLLL